MMHADMLTPNDKTRSLSVIKDACQQALVHEGNDHARPWACFHALVDPATVYSLVEMIERSPTPQELQEMKELLRDLAACVENSIDYNDRAMHLNLRHLVFRAKMMLNLVVL